MKSKDVKKKSLLFIGAATIASSVEHVRSTQQRTLSQYSPLDPVHIQSSAILANSLTTSSAVWAVKESWNCVVETRCMDLNSGSVLGRQKFSK